MPFSSRLVALATLTATLSACQTTGDNPKATEAKTTETVAEATKTLAKVNGQPERLFLQQISSDSAIIKWRGEAQEACVSSGGSPICSSAKAAGGSHKEAQFSGLESDTVYTYTVGEYSASSLQFKTAPQTGQLPKDGNVHIWIVGDSGTASEQYPVGNYVHPGEAQQVLDGFIHYNKNNNPVQKNEAVDLFLLLGDNAYVDGTDAEWQEAVFDLYTNILTQASTWPTIGNHEMGTGNIELEDGRAVRYPGGSISADPNSYVSRSNPSARRIPYLDIFSLPTQGEVGGVASGTEQYYSLDYGNVHIVSLDSQLSARDETQRAAMREWLVADLSSNQLDWTIVIFHHPPYTKGSHDSDKKPSSYLGIDLPIVYMREEFNPLFEDYGVDLVYGGHSHSYERSYYLNGHRGDANTFNAETHAELNEQGMPAIGNGEESYRQLSPSSNKDDKVVYTVAGSSGKVKLSKGKLDHPAHAIQALDPEKRHGLAELGSVVIDANRSELTARFINEHGEVRDTVVIQR